MTEMQLKIGFTVAIALVGVAMLFVDPTKNNAGPDRMWRGGKSDILRKLMCRQDGTLRPAGKPIFLALLAVFVGLIWVLPWK